MIPNDEKDDVPVTVAAAQRVSDLLWPEFACVHGCVFLARHKDSNPPPQSDTASGWESFVNHTHIFDEFENEAQTTVAAGGGDDPEDRELVYLETHQDFIVACELGKKVALLWALKLRLDFPAERFRVYYTQYDNPIVRFHKVRKGEAFWISDEDLEASLNPQLKEALVYDTAKLRIGEVLNPGLIQ